MIRTQYTIIPTDRSIDARAAADACNRELMASGETFDRDAAEKKISECAPVLQECLQIDAEEMIDVYTVDADSVTGEWLSEPEFSHVESVKTWNSRKDSDEIHFDTYESGQDAMNADTRAIEVSWVS